MVLFGKCVGARAEARCNLMFFIQLSLVHKVKVAEKVTVKVTVKVTRDVGTALMVTKHKFIFITKQYILQCNSLQILQ